MQIQYNSNNVKFRDLPYLSSVTQLPACMKVAVYAIRQFNY